jgi:hypothetical protein
MQPPCAFPRRPPRTARSLRGNGPRIEGDQALAERPAAQEEGARQAQGDTAAADAPGPLAEYLRELVERAEVVLGEELVAVYLAGSAALGGYVHGRSDVDVAVVVRAPLLQDTKLALVDALRHESLPCPARGLELVVYAQGRADPELNLNSGERMPFLATFGPGEDSPHWFVLDRAIIRQTGRPLVGPPPTETLQAPADDEILEALAIGLRWYRDRPEEPRGDATLNALRTRAWLEHGRWISKAEAAERLLDDVSSSVESRRGRSPRRDR